MKQTIAERVKGILLEKGMKAITFSQLSGFNYKTLNAILNGRIGESINLLLAVKSTFKDVNQEWLLTGKGNRYHDVKNDSLVRAYQLKTDHSINEQNIPLFEIEATAGLISLFNNLNNQRQIGELLIPNAPRCDGAIFVRGDSMYPILKSGDIVCFKMINDISNIYWGEMYVVDINVEGEQFLTIKYIQKSDQGDAYVRLVSHNANHSPKDELKVNIKALAIVKASIRYNTMA